LRDLFEEDNGGWLEDVGLLHRVGAEKVASEARKVAEEGWKWIEVAVDFRYGHTSQLRQLAGVSLELTPEEQATFDALTAEYARLESEYQGPTSCRMRSIRDLARSRWRLRPSGTGR